MEFLLYQSGRHANKICKGKIYYFSDGFMKLGVYCNCRGLKFTFVLQEKAMKIYMKEFPMKAFDNLKEAGI